MFPAVSLEPAPLGEASAVSRMNRRWITKSIGSADCRKREGGMRVGVMVATVAALALNVDLPEVGS